MPEISNFRFQIPDSSPMPTFKRFEELPVWQEAIRPPEGCEDFIAAARDRLSWSKRDQLDRDSFSASDNIAEGFERGTTNELFAFLYVAPGCDGEVRWRRCFLKRRPMSGDLKSQISHLRSLAKPYSLQLRAWVDGLQKSNLASPRRVTLTTARAQAIGGSGDRRRARPPSGSFSPNISRPVIRRVRTRPGNLRSEIPASDSSSPAPPWTITNESLVSNIRWIIWSASGQTYLSRVPSDRRHPLP